MRATLICKYKETVGSYYGFMKFSPLPFREKMSAMWESAYDKSLEQLRGNRKRNSLWKFKSFTCIGCIDGEYAVQLIQIIVWFSSTTFITNFV